MQFTRFAVLCGLALNSHSAQAANLGTVKGTELPNGNLELVLTGKRVFAVPGTSSLQHSQPVNPYAPAPMSEPESEDKSKSKVPASSQIPSPGPKETVKPGPVTIPPPSGDKPKDTSPGGNSKDIGITVLNNVGRPIWVAFGVNSNSVDQPRKEDAGFLLSSGDSKRISIPLGASLSGARIWAREGCVANGDDGLKCQTGDCDGHMACTRDTGVNGVTLVEFATESQGTLWYDLSVIDGFNIATTFGPVGSPIQGVAGTDCVTFSCSSLSCSPSQAYHKDSSLNPVGKCVTSQYTEYKVVFA